LENQKKQGGVKMNKETLKDLLEKLKWSLEEARREVDDLNGYLWELTEENDTGELEEANEDVADAMEELRDFFQGLPVYDTFDSMIEYVETVEEALEDEEEEE
jgi:phage shock protein A